MTDLAIYLLEITKDSPAFWLTAISIIFIMEWPKIEPTKLGQWICKWFPFSLIFCCRHIKEDIDAMDFKKPVQPKSIGKISAWIYMVLFSMFSMWFITMGATTSALGILKSYSQHEPLIGVYSVLFFITLGLIGYWYRGCAYRIARENSINLTPWKEFFKAI